MSKNFIFSKINYVLAQLGICLTNRPLLPNQISPLVGLSQEEIVNQVYTTFNKLKFIPSFVVDLGASDGRWSIPFAEKFPNTKIMLIEPLVENEKKLMQLASNNPNFSYERSLVGSSKGFLSFNSHGHQSSVFGNSSGKSFGTVTTSPVDTLDGILLKRQMPFPDFLKMDIQGSEIEAMKGAKKSLDNAKFVLSEFSLLPTQKGIPLLDDLVIFMKHEGFRIFNIFGVYGRPLDGIPAQGEILFIKSENGLINDCRWSNTSSWS